MESVKDLIVDVNSDGVSIALMENHRLIELNHESSAGHSFSVGDVYLGKNRYRKPGVGQDEFGIQSQSADIYIGRNRGGRPKDI